jgi:hypothetical protein
VKLVVRNTRAFSGPVERWARVSTNAVKTPRVSLIMKATFKPDPPPAVGAHPAPAGPF